MIKVQTNCAGRMPDSWFRSVRAMGIKYIAPNFALEDATYDGVMRLKEKAAEYGLEISDAGCPRLQKCAEIHLGKPDRDEWIARYNEFTRVLGKCGIPVNYIAWQPNGIQRTATDIGKYNRGMKSFICDMDEINARPIANDRAYGEKEIWDNFKYFIDRALPVCEEADVKLALHPNDPPVPELCGVHSLIYRTQDYDRAFELAGDSPYLTMKMCIGCWLESESFGNLMQDIETYCKRDKISIVHFRNVSSTMPYFEETLLEDGYADMYAIMKQLVKCGYNGFLNIDHSFFDDAGKRPDPVSEAYFLGYMKAMLMAAEREA